MSSTSIRARPKSAVTPIDPFDDSRITHRTAILNRHTYHYLFGEPKSGAYGSPKGTVFLVHGFPDLAVGWRYQIPVLLEWGFRVVAMDFMGYGGTDAPKVPPNNLNLYGMKRASDDIAELARQLGYSKIILGGHDWGGMIVWRCIHWHPDLVSHIFAVCTPYSPPKKHFIPTSEVARRAPRFTYQLHLASGEIEEKINTPEKIRQVLNGMYGGKGPNGEVIFDPTKGLLFENLDKLKRGGLLTDRELDYYAEQYSRNGFHGPVNWYRTAKVNYDEELQLEARKMTLPALFIQADRDDVLTPEMGKGMEEWLPNLSRGAVDGTHWILTQKPDEVNAILKDWFQKEVLGGKRLSSL